MSISGRKSKSSKRHDAGASRVPAPNVPLQGDGDGFFSDKEWASIAGKLGLSLRETEIARCVVADQGDRQISRTLSISLHTVQTHLVHLYQKMGVQSRLGVLRRLVHVQRDWQTDSCPPPGVNEISD